MRARIWWLGLCLWMACGGSLEASPGVSLREVRLGAHQPLSGPFAGLGAVRTGIDIYFQYINDQGGVHGRQLSYRVKDDGFQPERTREVVTQLITQDQVLAFFGSLGTRTHASVSEQLRHLKIPDFFVGSESPQWTEPVQETVFGFLPTPAIEGRILGKHLRQAHAGQQVLVWHSEDSLGKAAAQSLAQVFTQPSVKFLAQSERAESVTALVNQIKEAQAQVVVIWVTPAMAGPFLKLARAQGLTATLYLGSVLADSQWLSGFEAQALEGLAMLTPFPLVAQTEDPALRFHQKLLQTYAPSTTVSRWTIYGQALAETMVHILEKAGRDLTRERLIQAAESLNKWQGTLAPPITLTPTSHQAVQHLRLVKFENGGYRNFSPWIDAQ